MLCISILLHPLLCLFHIILALLYSAFYALSNLSSLLDIKLVLRFCLQNGLIERGSRESTIKELVRQYTNRAIGEHKLSVINYRQILVLVVLVIRDIQTQLLINILIHNLYLAIRLRVIHYKQLQFSAQYPIKLYPKRQYKLQTAIRNNQYSRAVISINGIEVNSSYIFYYYYLIAGH